MTKPVPEEERDSQLAAVRELKLKSPTAAKEKEPGVEYWMDCCESPLKFLLPGPLVVTDLPGEGLKAWEMTRATSNDTRTPCRDSLRCPRILNLRQEHPGQETGNSTSCPLGACRLMKIQQLAANAGPSFRCWTSRNGAETGPLRDDVW